MDTIKTFLYGEHIALGAKMAPFAGFLMPIQYSGTLREHEAARKSAAVFDTSHMGEINVSGPSALDDLEKLISCDIAPLQPGRCRYGLLCNENGGVLDDLVVYRMAPDSFMVVVNAGTREDDLAWIKSRASRSTKVEGIFDRTAKIDLQGPASPKMLSKLVKGALDGFSFYSFRHMEFEGKPVIVSRTGYTGEIGFEIYGDPDTVIKFWRRSLEAGAAPAGLGARDTLRLEMGMPLYGHELSKDINAAESGFTRSISVTKHFTGCDAIREPSAKKRALVGLTMEGRRSARSGDLILRPDDGSSVGIVTSGSFAPSLGKAVALGYVDLKYAEAGTNLTIKTARENINGTISALPFYGKATGKMPISDFLS